MALRKINLRLDHHQPELFTRSQWDKGPKPSLLYVLYRLAASLLVVGLVTASVSISSSPRWLVFLTNQGGVLLAFHSLLEGWLVVSSYRSNSSPPSSLTTLHKITWALQTTAWCTALQISLAYWLAVHPFLVSRGLLTSTQAILVVAVPGHTLNSLACLFDSLISSRPTSICHFWIPLTFGAFYLLVNLLYWSGGGLGLCKIHCVSTGSNLNMTNYSFARPPGVLMVVQACNQPPPCDTLVCEDYLYPPMDWSCKPGLAVALVCAILAATPLVQMFWWSIYKLRLKLASSLISREDDQCDPHQLEVIET